MTPMIRAFALWAVIVLGLVALFGCGDDPTTKHTPPPPTCRVTFREPELDHLYSTCVGHWVAQDYWEPGDLIPKKFYWCDVWVDQ